MEDGSDFVERDTLYRSQNDWSICQLEPFCLLLMGSRLTVMLCARPVVNVTLKSPHTTSKKTAHRRSMGSKHLNDMSMFRDEERYARIKRYIRNGYNIHVNP